MFFRLWNVLLAQEWDANEVTGKKPRQPYELYRLLSVFEGVADVLSENKISQDKILLLIKVIKILYFSHKW